jgi:flagellar secretion chaperone FliS
MNDPRAAYLETQIKTATPQRLRLMLIEGALRFARQAKEATSLGQSERAADYFDRCRDVVGELLAGIRPGPHRLNEVARALYGFVYQSLAEAQLLGDGKKVDDALRVLEEERETWLQVCKAYPEAPLPTDDDPYRNQEVFAPSSAEIVKSASFTLDA